MKYLATDLDNTLITSNRGSGMDSLGVLFRLIKENNWGLLYVTARSISSVMELIKGYNLNIPDYLVSQMGTKIHKSGNTSKEIIEWQEIIKSNNPAWDAAKIITVLKNIRNISMQENNENNEYKISFYIHHIQYIGEILDIVSASLKKINISANITITNNPEKNMAYLDILPFKVNKYFALKCLANFIGFDDLIYAGDSENDLAVLNSKFKSILVNNASLDMKKKVMNSGCYIAKENYSSGIIEGLKHYCWVTDF